MSLAQNFYDLFKGSDIAHGTFVVKSDRESDGKKQGTAKIIREPTTLAMWEEHLKGSTRGLGIIPIKSDNTCHWGAIDIDEYIMDSYETLCGAGGALPEPIVMASAAGAKIKCEPGLEVCSPTQQPRTRWWGVALMFYPYVVSATWLLYAVGVALCLGLWWDGQRG